jgi:hypothetical protein
MLHQTLLTHSVPPKRPTLQDVHSVMRWDVISLKGESSLTPWPSGHLSHQPSFASQSAAAHRLARCNWRGASMESHGSIVVAGRYGFLSSHREISFPMRSDCFNCLMSWNTMSSTMPKFIRIATAMGERVEAYPRKEPQRKCGGKRS